MSDALSNEDVPVFRWSLCDERMPTSHNGVSEWSPEVFVCVRHPGRPHLPDADWDTSHCITQALYHTRLKVWIDSDHALIEDYTDRVIAWALIPEVPESLTALDVSEKSRG